MCVDCRVLTYRTKAYMRRYVAESVTLPIRLQAAIRREMWDDLREIAYGEDACD